jgi:dimethylhistidine N-methyltransferase
MKQPAPAPGVGLPAATPGEFLRDVLAGLGAPSKTLPCKYFYDEHGSRLFDRICELDEYYLTRCELAILRQHGPAMAGRLGEGCALIEYGSGSSLKTQLLLDRLPGAVAYVPVDISGEHLLRSARRLARRYPALEVAPVCADFTAPFALPALRRPARRRVVYFSGSTIGNFGPPEATTLLASIARVCGPGGGLLIGVDLDKDPRILEPAYNDARGVTAEFNLNLLTRINRELGADFTLDAFRHHAFYDTHQRRIEMQLVSLRPQTVRVAGTEVRFAEGESIRTEYSYKYTLDDFRRLAGAAGLEVEQVWTDEQGLYSVQYLGVRPGAG